MCENKREYSNCVFKGYAHKGKSTMGWYYGFKLHLLCNERGELLNFALTKANVEDRNLEVSTTWLRIYSENSMRTKHTRHRSISNFIVNLLAGMAAYAFYDTKPSINMEFVMEGEAEVKQLTLF